MARLGVMVCNRCRLGDLQKEAEARGMSITMRKSMYGTKPGLPGVDIYIHPKSLEIPSHYKCKHDGEPGNMAALAEFLPEDDPDKWWEAWFTGIPEKCVCKEATQLDLRHKHKLNW